MKHLIKYDKFFEDGTATVNASTTAGMGDVSNPVVGDVPGVPGPVDGSGDTTFYLKNKRRRKSSDPSQVSDLRDLEPPKK